MKTETYLKILESFLF